MGIFDDFSVHRPAIIPSIFPISQRSRAMAEWKVPDLAVAVVKDEAVIYSRGFGFRDLERSLPVTPHTIFR